MSRPLKVVRSICSISTEQSGQVVSDIAFELYHGLKLIKLTAMPGMLYPHRSGFYARLRTHLSYEGPCDWRRRQGARAGVEAAPVAAGVTGLLPARERRHLRGGYVRGRRPQE